MDNVGFEENGTVGPREKTSFSEIFTNGEKFQPTAKSFTKSCKSETKSNISIPSTEGKSPYTRFRSFLSYLQIEIFVFLITFATAVTKVSSTSLILNKSCTVHSGYSTEICGNLQNFSIIKSSVEKVAANYNLARILLLTVPAVFVTIFFMPWSDIYSRKLPLQLAMVGAAVESFAGALCSFNMLWGLEYYFIGTLFLALFGGNILIVAIVYCLVSDFSTVDQRTTKFAFFEISRGLSLCLSVVTGGWISEHIGYTTVFSFSAVSLVLAFLWLTFLVPESRGLGNTDNWQIKARSLFSFRMLIVGFQAVAKKLPSNGRLVVIMTIVSMCINQTALLAHFDIVYLYVHHQFDWSNSQYSDVLSLYLGLSFLIMFLLRPLLQRFDFSDGLIAMLGNASFIIKYTLLGLAWNTNLFHVASALGILLFLGNCGLRSHLSKLVSVDDSGKVFSFVSIAEGVAPLIGSVFLTQIFNFFLDSYAGAPFLLLCMALLFPFSVSVWISNMCTSLLKCIRGSKKIQHETNCDVEM